ncbi:hypothetical protein [Microvirga sp. M2]
MVSPIVEQARFPRPFGSNIDIGMGFGRGAAAGLRARLEKIIPNQHSQDE